MPQIDRRGATMQTLDSYVAAAQVADRHAAAATVRAARRARKASAAAAGERLVLRRSTPDDAVALTRLARLDSAPRPQGEMLVAEVEDEIVAAVPFDGGRAIADPFRPTADIVELLRARAELLSPRRARSRGARFRVPRVRVA
jgi:hypothetical protein